MRDSKVDKVREGFGGRSLAIPCPVGGCLEVHQIPLYPLLYRMRCRQSNAHIDIRVRIDGGVRVSNRIREKKAE